MDRNPVPKRRKDAIKPMASEVGSAWMSSLDDLEDSRWNSEVCGAKLYDVFAWR